MEERALQSSLKYSNKIALITGSGTGIGFSIAKRFAENGASIIILGRRKGPLEQTESTLNKIMADNGSSARIRSFPGIDVSDESGINDMIKKIGEEFGKIDIVVNNAGVSGPVKAFTNANFTEFKECVAIHLTGTFWTTRQCLQMMERGSKIITISTFFSEENRHEQRPYRFRTPYTAAQGAKNRLAEALAWELADRNIRSIATNPGPVHSDRIYKTVYPKAAAEFLRISGYSDLSSSQIEYACSKLLPLLGDDDALISATLRDVAQDIKQSRRTNSANIDTLVQTLTELMGKVQEIAEKIQNNTRNMIVDREFLSQDDVADTVLNLCDEKLSRLINGRIVPSDSVFYPVKPQIRTTLDNTSFPFQVTGKVVIVIANPANRQELDRLEVLTKVLHQEGVKDLTLFLPQKVTGEFRDFSCIEFDISNENQMKAQIHEVRKKSRVIDAVIYLTGNYDYNQPILSISRDEWEFLVNRFINIPALVTKESVNAMCPDAELDPIKYKNSEGKIILIGPESPIGTKISGPVRARSEIFRGALRPYTATVNQELFEVLGSSIRLFLILPGNIEGSGSNVQSLSQSVVQILSNQIGNNNDSIFYVDEVRK
jgi:NAD(P)-dependent dehydrogenase (short-subunit alcohol dehydrogenase family)